jgi:predicted permease
MNFLKNMAARFPAFFRRKKLDADMAEEMGLHLERRTQSLISEGLSPEDARYAAQRQFGGVDQLKELAREQRSGAWLEEISRDMRHAARSLLKQPGFAMAALATLALCLGANLAIFAVVQATLLRSLPFPDADRLVTLYYTYPKLPSANPGASLTNYYERRGRLPAFSSLAAMNQVTSVVGEPGATSVEKLGRVTSEFFETLGVQPFMGRAFTDAEMTYQTDGVAMISHEYWRNHLGSNPDVLGTSIRLDGIPRVIVGVLPPGFRFLSFQAPVFMPLSSEEGERNVGARHAIGKILIGRLAPGATLAAAKAQVDALDAAIAPAFADAKIIADSGCSTSVVPLHADSVAAIRPVLLLLQGGALCLLLIGGVNLVNLLLIRASNRTRELAIRRALGATHHHVIRATITETLLLAFIGSLLGLGVGALGIKLVALLGADRLPLGAQIEFDSRLAAAAVVGAIVTGIGIGLPVAWFNLRSRLGVVLQSESRGSTAGRATQRLRHGFIVAQVALAFVLLTGAGLLGLSLQRAMAVSPGFRADHVMTGQFNLTWQGYRTLPAFRAFFDPLYEKTRALPGVTAVGAVSAVPVSGSRHRNPMTVPGYTPPPGETVLVHDLFAVAGDYFAAMNIPLRAGRYLDQADAHREQQVCVVDEVFARHYWPDGDAVGKEVYRGTTINARNKPFRIVGVVGAVKQSALTEQKPRSGVYFPYTQMFVRSYFLVARTTLPPETVGTSLAKTIRAIDPDMPLTDLRTMEVRIADSLTERRSPALLAGLFAVTALLLATIGLYGVMAYGVAQRRSEFGIRMALGAQRSDVLRLVFRQGVRLIAQGLALGLVTTLVLSDALSAFLFQVRANDPLALGGVATLLALVALLACWIPSRRAMRVDPMVALRAE